MLFLIIEYEAVYILYSESAAVSCYEAVYILYSKSAAV